MPDGTPENAVRKKEIKGKTMNTTKNKRNKKVKRFEINFVLAIILLLHLNID
ncbi:MAG: hypothetical protein ACP5TO_03110 [Thermoplasmata archaeon]